MMNYSKSARVLDNTAKLYFALASIGSVGLVIPGLLDLDEWLFIVYGLSAFLVSLIIFAAMRTLAEICEEVVRIRVRIEENPSTSDSPASSSTEFSPNSVPVFKMPKD